MTIENRTVRWAGKVARDLILRLYQADARGIVDEELIAAVGWGLWSRCDSILTVTAAHYGRVRCPGCGDVIEHAGQWRDDEDLLCTACGFQMAWKNYHQTYRGKQLFGANAVESFAAYHEAFPKAQAANEKMLLIDQLIHAFHISLKMDSGGKAEIGRPVGANLIQGTMKEVVQFLDELTSGGASAAGIGDSRAEWRRTLETAPWSRLFLPSELDTDSE